MKSFGFLILVFSLFFLPFGLDYASGSCGSNWTAVGEASRKRTYQPPRPYMTDVYIFSILAALGGAGLAWPLEQFGDFAAPYVWQPEEVAEVSFAERKLKKRIPTLEEITITVPIHKKSGRTPAQNHKLKEIAAEIERLVASVPGHRFNRVKNILIYASGESYASMHGDDLWVIFSLEESSAQVAELLIDGENGIPLSKLPAYDRRKFPGSQ